MLVEGERSWVGATRWAREHVVGRLPEHADRWVAKLGQLSPEGNGVLISCADRTTELLSQRRREIPSSLVSFESPSSAHLALMNKASLYEIAERAGVRFPRTSNLVAIEQLDRVASEATFPCLIKPVHSHRWRAVFGERRVIVVDNARHLVREATPALEVGLELLVTEHIPGPDDHLDAAYTVRGADGTYALACGRRKIRMHPPGYGAAAIVESVAAPETLELSKRLLDAAGFVGVSSTEFKRHAGTGKHYLIETNVRLPQAWGLVEVARTEGSWRLYAALAGLPLKPPQTPRLGVRNVIPSLELRSAPTHLAERRLTPQEVLSGYRGVRGFSGLSWRDPRPALRLAGENAIWAWGHLRERWRPRAVD